METTENYYVSTTKESKKYVSNVFESQLNKLEIEKIINTVNVDCQ